jgi:diguanylate cyclase (GGDEF)-like protein
MKILVADDSKTSLAILTGSLKKLGHEIIGATSGKEAIELFTETQPDLIILDVLMQHMSGFECAKKLRALNTDIWVPIIFLSSAADDRSISQGIDAGGDDYLTKPFSDITLAAKIKTMQRIADMQKKLYELTCKLSILSSTDSLTNLDNRLQFDRVIKEQIAYASRYHTKLALLFLDLDHFKEINDHLSHHIGDLLLQEVAKRLKACLRSYDFLARLGGDEFAIILKINQPKDANTVAQKILDALKPAYNLESNCIHISGSVGIACYPTSGLTSEILIQRADIAMYYAKELGRNNFQHYTEEFQPLHKQRFFLESALRFALDNNELFMCYQPIFQLEANKVIGMEALMRWNHPKFGLISPDIFIPIAEEIGIISTIGDWALRSVCEQAMQWHKNGYKSFKLSVNISSRQLLHTGLIKLIKNTLQATQFPPHLLELELTESIVMSSSNRVEKIIQEISDMNIGISLDDFGTGYSSLSHLKRLPITALKIDKSFIMDIMKDPNDALIVKSIISLGKILNLNLIAEGIETQEQLQFMIKNQCQCGQGFYLSKPLSPEEMGLLLQKTKHLEE